MSAVISAQNRNRVWERVTLRCTVGLGCPHGSVSSMQVKSQVQRIVEREVLKWLAILHTPSAEYGGQRSVPNERSIHGSLPLF